MNLKLCFNRKMQKWYASHIIMCFLLFSSQMFAQQTNSILKGSVKDPNGEPIIGAAIVVKEVKTSGTITDFDGNFSLNIPKGKVTLIVTYMGYKEKQIEVQNTNSIKIVLEENLTQLDEVQVIAYGSQKKVTITGAISSVQSSDILKSPVGSMTNALTGKLPGVSTVQYSGQPGADDALILVRGIGNPLVLVDGVERSFSQIDPNEVEDITVLKDASATAVFGIRGANGVILVTTKRGTVGKARISASTSFSLQQPTRMPKFANSYTWAKFNNEMRLSDNPTTTTGLVNDEILEAFRTGSNPILYPSVDWIDMLTNKTALQSQHNLNISGGTEKFKYFISTGLFTQEGIFKTFETDYNSNFDYKRYNYRANLDYNFTNTSKLSLNIGGRVESSNIPNSSNSQDEIFRFLYRSSPFSGAGIIDGKRVLTSYEYLPLPAGGLDGLDVLYGRGFKSTVNNVINLDFAFQQKLDIITKGLIFNIKGSLNSSYSTTKTRNMTTPYYTPVKNSDGSIGYRKSADEGELSFGETYGADRNWYSEVSFNYNRKFGQHNVSSLVLFNQSKNYYPTVFPGIATGYVGLVGRITYDYATKYLIDFNMGYNGSENFAIKSRYGFFPAASAGWIITQEPFMKTQKVVSYLKLRASYGLVGNDKNGSSRFMYLPDPYTIGSRGYIFGTNVTTVIAGASEGTKGNQDLTWDKDYKQNYGIDVYFLKDKLKFNIDYFFEHRTDMLITRKAPPGFLGMTLPTVNMGIQDNSGYEITAVWNDKVNKDFRYWTNVNLSYAKNIEVEMDEVKPPYDYMRLTGKAVWTPLLYDFWGFYDENANDKYKAEFGQDIAKHSAVLKPGDCVYKDLNGDAVIDANDQTTIGYTNNPQYTASMTVGVEYKKFEFSMLWIGAMNTSRLLEEGYRQPLGSQNFASLLQSQYDNRWTPETAATATLPRPTIINAANNYLNSDLWLIDASYVRLKNIEIAYTFNSAALKKAGINNLRLFATGNNLLTIDKMKFIDPETRTNTRPTYPVMRIYNLGVKFDF